MKYSDFRNFSISRTCNKVYKDFHDYREYLRNDFNHRCGYCNVSDDFLSNYLEIDHFVPCDYYSNNNLDSLETDYTNLIYCCKKCNLAKSNKYDNNGESYDNILFYDPVRVNYNSIFYRNEYGRICSNDDKGNQMIINLKLYRPIHNMEFILDEIENVKEMLENKIEEEKDGKKRTKYSEQYILLLKTSDSFQKVFRQKYKSKSFVDCKIPIMV